jgi:hypothetical protein
MVEVVTNKDEKRYGDIMDEISESAREIRNGVHRLSTQ